MKQPTVQQLIDSLSRFPMDAPVEIEISQYNKRYPVAYISPSESVMVEGNFATMNNGQNVRISISLPSEGDKFMFVSERKKS